MRTFVSWLKNDVKDGIWIDTFSDIIRTCICSWAKCNRITYYNMRTRTKTTACKRCGSDM